MNEAERIARLQSLAILDTEPEAMFDALTRLASEACGVPIALISLVDSERQWFKSNIGLPETIQTPRDVSFCSQAILAPEIMEVNDALTDPRFADSPLVTGDPDIRFYAGAPITVSGGLRVGTLCVIDRAPKKLSVHQLGMLRQLAVAVAQALEFRERSIHSLEAARQSELALQKLYTSSPAMLHVTDSAGQILAVSNTWLEELGYDRDEIIDRSLLDFLSPRSAKQIIETNLPQLWKSGRCDDIEYEMICKDGSMIDVLMSATLERDDNGEPLQTLSLAINVDRRRKDHSESTLINEYV